MTEEKSSLEIGNLSQQVHACRDKPADIQDAHLLTCSDKHSLAAMSTCDKYLLAAINNRFPKPAFFLACRAKRARYVASLAVLCLWVRAFIHKYISV